MNRVIGMLLLAAVLLPAPAQGRESLAASQGAHPASARAAHGGSDAVRIAAGEKMAAPQPPAAAGKTAEPADDLGDYVESADEAVAEGADRGAATIADPLEPFNRAMYLFNDRLYFWVFKPVAQGYRAVVPELARVGVSNFFTNIAFPVRFVNCLLQANLPGAAREVGRFVLNTLGGAGGLLDPASHEEVGLARQDEDLGQTLGVYGVGQGIYINWPLLGPSSPRDTLGTIGDWFLHPLAYYPERFLESAGVTAVDRVNETSLTIGDYEALTEAAIDPYVAIRDAYVQYRLNKVKDRDGRRPASGAAGKPSGATAP
ncbi:MAG: MlaA family lipoprotein [Syntrophales bacterium]